MTDECDEFGEKPDSEDIGPQAPGGAQPPTSSEAAGAPPSSDAAGGGAGATPADDVAEIAAVEDEDGYHYKQDKIGRWYKYDKHGNRVYSKPLHGTLKPPSIPGSEWRKLSKKAKSEVHRTWQELEDAKNY